MFLEFSLKRCLVRSLLVAFAVSIGEIVPKFDLVMGVIGGTLTGPLIFILPPLFYMKITKMERLYDEEMLRQQLDRIALDDDSEDDRLINKSRYGTFKNSNNMNKNVWQKCIYYCGKLYSDVILAVAVILFGLGATFASTYFSIFNVSNIAEFWSPCINNISYSFLGL